MNRPFNRGARRVRRMEAALRAAAGRSAPARSAHFEPISLQPMEQRQLLAADLNVSAISTVTTVVAPGSPFSAEFIVENDGDSVTTPFRIEFRLSRDSIWGNGDDVLIGFTHINAPIAPGGQINLDQDFDLPRNVSTFTYFLGAFADSLGQITEPNENNNLRFTGLAQIIATNPNGQVDIDLEAEGVAATTGTYNAGQAFPGVATYTNNGAAPSGAFVTIWFLSTNQIFGDADDIQLAVATSTGGLAAGQSFPDAFQFQIPISAPSGSYFFGVFVDARHDVNEPLEEDNNIDFSATPAVTVVGVPMIPDLQAVEVTTTPATYEPGDEITFTATIRNGGNAATGPFEVTYNLTTDSTQGNSDDVVLAFKVVLGSIAAGATITDTRTVAIPDLAPAGAYFLGMVLDPDDDIEEGNAENNNTDLTPTALVTIELPPPPVPDITLLGGGGLNSELGHNTKAKRSNGTGYGPVEVDQGQKEITYKIRNTGLQPLIITLMEPRGQRPEDYEIIVFPEFTIEPGESSNFRVRFVPSAFGTRRANIAVFSNDPDRPRFTMKVAGRGMPPDSAADIGVRGNGNSISDNDRKARSNTDTKYGNTPLGEMSERIYTIRNDGQSTLTLASPFVRIGGQDPTHFLVVTQPAATVLAPGQSTTFTVAFSPNTQGQKRADIEILSDDPDEGVFNFRIVGTGITT